MEGLHKVCPKRKKTKGRKPSVSGKEQAKSKSTEEEDSLWSSPTREPTTLEKRKLLACMLEIGIVASFGLHIYSFAGKIYQQKVGGPIGSRLTMAVSQVVMALLGAKLKKYLTQGEIQIFLEACYVDDLRFILSLLPSYMAWDRQTKMFVDARSTQNPCTQTPPQKSQAKQYPTPKLAAHQTPPPTPPSPKIQLAQWVELSPSELVEHTKQQFLEVINSCFNFLSFTAELQTDYSDNYMPTLDLKAKLTGENKMTYQFFEKPTTSKYCVMREAAMGEQSKIAILSQEVNRRLLNTCEEEPQEVRDQVLNNFNAKLTVSGYDEDQVKQIMRRGVIRYETLRILDRQGKRRLHRPAWTTEEERARKKLTSKEDWYREKEQNEEDNTRRKDYSAVPLQKGLLRRTSAGRIKKNKKNGDPAAILFVRRTPGGKLVNMLRKEEEILWPILGHRLKMVERCGVKLKSLLWKAEPLGGISCEDQNCPMCQEEGGRSICKIPNIIYTNTCKTCKSEGRTTQYVGESSRTMLERAKEHVRDRTDAKKTSHMRDHTDEEHPGQEVGFRFDVVKRCSSALERQVGETIKVKVLKKGGCNIINSKVEYNRCLLPTLMVTGERSTEDNKTRMKTREDSKSERKKEEEKQMIEDFQCEERDKKLKRDRHEHMIEEDQGEKNVQRS